MKYIMMLCWCLTGFSCLAQRNGDADIPDSVIGWWNNNRYDHLKPQTEPLNKKKEALTTKMVEWMKASYTPVAGLGTSNRYLNKLGYGVFFGAWNVSHDKEWTDARGHFVPIAEENTQFIMAANRMFGAFPIDFLNKRGSFYFTMQPDGYADNSQMMEMRRGSDKRIHPNAYSFITWMNDWCTVYLTPDNKLPFIPVSRGELLQQAEDALAREWDSADVYQRKDIEKYRNNIRQLRARYSETLKQPAVIRSMQTNWRSFDLDPDIFSLSGSQGELKHAFPVYKMDPVALSKMGSDTPRWVAVAWPFKNQESGNRDFEMFTALSQNINYAYISDYFFHPDRVAGKSYVPANADQLKERLEGYRRKTAQQKQTVARKLAVLPPNFVLSEDFSRDSDGGKPAGWSFSNFGKGYIVSSVKGQSGHWLKMGNSTLTPATITVLPEHFSMEFDLLTGSFDGRTGAGIELALSGSKKGADGKDYTSNIEISIVSGNQSALEAAHDYRGAFGVKLFNRPSLMPYNEKGGYFTAALSGFTNVRSKAHIKLLREGDGLSVWVNDIPVFHSGDFKTMYGKPCGDCSILPGMQYNSLSFRNTTQEADVVDAYLGNMIIKKER